jgi:hypothetical protein
MFDLHVGQYLYAIYPSKLAWLCQEMMLTNRNRDILFIFVHQGNDVVCTQFSIHHVQLHVLNFIPYFRVHPYPSSRCE